MNPLGNGPVPFHLFNSSSAPLPASSSSGSGSGASSASSSSSSSKASGSLSASTSATSTSASSSSASQLAGLSTSASAPSIPATASSLGVGGGPAPPRRTQPYQKPIRGTFKVPEGTYRLQREFSLFRTAQRHPSRHFNPSKLVGVHLKRTLPPLPPSADSQSSSHDSSPTEADVFYFSVNSDAGLFCDKYCLKRPFQRFEQGNHTVRFNASAQATCHDFNRTTQSSNKIEIAIGFNTGQVLVHDPFFKSISNQINFTMQLTNSRITAIRWVPGSRSQFVTAHLNGQLMVFDKDRTEERAPTIMEDRDSFVMLRQKTDVENPVCIWRITKSAINDLCFSPDGEFLAVVSQDGYLRVFHWKRERLLLSFRSYFGGLLSVAWSPDCKYLLTGGEDDLVTVWSLRDRYPVCRGEGHRSWVSVVDFDRWRCDSTGYRFGSVGQDGQLILWELVLDSLPRPRTSSFGVISSTTSLSPGSTKCK